MDFSELVGKTLVSVENISDEVLEFKATSGEVFQLYHDQDCCESVCIEDICGDLECLVGSPVLQADESTNKNDPPIDGADDSYTWTFYRIATIKGSVVIRWFGSSNGYYSKDVSFRRVA